MVSYSGHLLLSSDREVIVDSWLVSCYFFMLLKNYHNKIVYYSKVCCHITFQSPTLNDANVASTSEIHTAAMVILVIDRCIINMKLIYMQHFD
jgi:hypothetical protein